MGTSRISNWAVGWFDESQGFLQHWLPLYLLMVMLGVVADVAYCWLGPRPAVWAQILPEIHYIGVLYAAICFGARIGLVAGCVAALLHLAAVTMVCSEPGSQLGHLTTFAGIGLVTGWISKGQYNYVNRMEPAMQATAEVGRGSSLADLGRMMPEFVQQLLTPIASIEGAGYVLEESDLSDDKRHEFVGIIQKECRRLELLVLMLDFTDSRARVHEDANVGTLLDEVVERCRMTADSRITLGNLAPLDSIRVRCDPELMKYALQTLTASAIRAIHQSGTVELSASLTPGEIVITIEAHSDPRGLPALNGPVARDLSGADLVIVQQILKRHRGSVRTLPASGAVTTHVILPLKPAGPV
ncbi:MAG: sensor histidine kinase [Bryobacteraceae bacterium]